MWIHQTGGVTDSCCLGLPVPNDGAWIQTLPGDSRNAVANTAPNPSGFMQACKTAIGLPSIMSNASLFAMVQLAQDAIALNNLADLATIITTANTNALITSTEYAAIKAAATANNIGVTLP